MEFKFDISYKIYELLESAYIMGKLLQEFSTFGEYQIYCMPDDKRDILVFKNGRFEIYEDIVLLRFRLNVKQAEKLTQKNNRHYVFNTDGLYETTWKNDNSSCEEISNLINLFI